jgi:hypothetical protein
MFKKAIQRGRSERKAEAYPCGALRGLERRENEAGSLFQHPAKRAFGRRGSTARSATRE